LALTLGVLVLSSLLGLFFSFVQVWSSNTKHKDFYAHVDGVCDFLGKIFNGPAFPVEGWNDGSPVEWRKFTPPNAMHPMAVLSTSCRVAPAFLRSTYDFSTSVILYFYHQERTGLFVTGEGKIYEKSDFSLSDVPKEKYQRTCFLISPWVEEWSFGYYDLSHQRWEYRSTPLKNPKTHGENIPDLLKVTFRNETTTVTRWIPLKKLNPLLSLPKRASALSKKAPKGPKEEPEEPPTNRPNREE
jgi:hypothetical protein